MKPSIGYPDIHGNPQSGRVPEEGVMHVLSTSFPVYKIGVFRESIPLDGATIMTGRDRGRIINDSSPTIHIVIHSC